MFDDQGVPKQEFVAVCLNTAKFRGGPVLALGRSWKVAPPEELNFLYPLAPPERVGAFLVCTGFVLMFQL